MDFSIIGLHRAGIKKTATAPRVRHVFDAVNNLPDGKVSTSHILVLQVWKRDNGAWKLFARQSAPLKA